MDSRDHWSLTLLVPYGRPDKKGAGEGTEYPISGLFNRLDGAALGSG